MKSIPARDERFWNRLLSSIKDGHVVPVIGSQLLVWGEPDNPQTLQRLVAKQMLRDLWVAAGSPIPTRDD